MNRVFRYRTYPTRKQAVLLEQMLQDHYDIYNAALQERREVWQHSGVRVQYKDRSAQLKAVRADGQYSRWSLSSQQQTLRRPNHTFEAFLTRVKRGDKLGYPRSKPNQPFNTVTFIHGDGDAFL